MIYFVFSGCVPFNDKNNTQVWSYVGMMNGHLEFPDLCPQLLREKLNECWHVEPDNRPSFHLLVDALRETKTELEAEMPDSGKNFQSKIYHDNSYYVKTKLDEHVPDIQVDTKKQQNESSSFKKWKKHKSCAIFSLIFLVMMAGGIAYTFLTFNPRICTPGHYGFPDCQGMIKTNN